MEISMWFRYLALSYSTLMVAMAWPGVAWTDQNLAGGGSSRVLLLELALVFPLKRKG